MPGQRTEVRPGLGNVLREVQIPPVELCPCDSGCGGVFCIPSEGMVSDVVPRMVAL